MENINKSINNVVLIFQKFQFLFTWVMAESDSCDTMNV